MTIEQAKAYKAWWSDPATLTNTKACFVAGWNAAPRPPVKVSDLPIIDRTKEEEFEKWWAHSSAKLHCSENTAQWIWNSAWCTAKLGQLDRAKAEVLSEVKAILFADATSAFLDGDDAEAISLRDIANNLGK